MDLFILKEGKIIEDDKILELIEYYINTYKLESSINNFKIDKTLPTSYSTLKKEVIINKEEILNSKLKWFENENLNILWFILHELQHAKQCKIIKTTKNQLIKETLAENIFYTNANYNVYKNNHNDFITEYNANLISSLETVKTSLRLNIKTNNASILKYLSQYKIINNKIKSPQQTINEILGTNYCEQELIEKKDYKNMSATLKILYGFPLETEKFKDIQKKFIKKR